MENRKNNTWLIVLLILIILGLLGFICYDKFYNKEFKIEHVDIKSNTNVAGENIIKLSGTEIANLGKALFNKTSVMDYNSQLYFYKKNNLTYNDLSDSDRLSIAYSLIPNYFIKKNNKTAAYCHNVDYGTGEYGYAGKPDSPDKNCSLAMVSKDIFSDSYYNIFGQKTSVKYEEFNPLNDIFKVVVPENDILRLYNTIVSGDVWNGLFTAVKFDYAEMDGESLCVFSKLVAIDDEKGVYSDSEYSNKIDNISSLGDNWFDSGNLDNLNNSIMNKYSDKAGKYKLVFNQDANGNWYWVSTELVK